MKQIKDFPEYFVTEDGEVFSNWTKKFLKKYDRNEYLTVALTKYENGKKILKNKRINILVCEAFNGPKPSHEYQCAHLDGNRYNNHFSNLKWATAKENAEHRDLHGTTYKGDRHYKTKLTEENVKDIIASYKRYSANESNARDLAKKYGVSKQSIKSIIRGSSWGWMNGGEIRNQPKMSKLNDEQKKFVLENYWAEGKKSNGNELATKFGVTKAYIQHLFIVEKRKMLNAQP